MQVAIVVTVVSDRNCEYITRKAEKLVKYLDTVSEIDVTIEFEGPRVAVEMLVEIDGYHNSGTCWL
ncbi:MAG: HPF/RaiA family ribosome-associated protein [Planctomycetaceae bacterium]